MSFIEIEAGQTALSEALEQYYEQLMQLIGHREGQPVLLNNTITTFDINKDAPFYTEGMFRNFADRKFTVSPESLGSAIKSDRFSYDYENVVEIAAAQIDGTIPQPIKDKIDAYKAEIRRVRKEFVLFEKEVNLGWDAIVASENLNPENPKYELRRINYLESILYADEVALYTQEIEDYRGQINTLRVKQFTKAQQKLLRVNAELAETYKIARPWNIYYERDFPNTTVLDFADPKLRIKTLCDVSPAIFPSADLVTFQQRGGISRTIKVDQTTTHNQLHTRTWKARGRGGFKAFKIRIGGSGGGSGSSSYKRDFEKITSFEMNFKGLDEVYVDRGLWYDPSLLNNAELKPIFDNIPGARDLEYVAVSLIIGRGLKLKLNFSETVETERWSKQNFNARGGLSVFGYSFGARGSRSRYDYDFKKSTDEKSVLFEDTDDHCRLLGIRLQKVYQPIQPTGNAPITNEALEKIISGEMTLNDYQMTKLRRDDE